MRGDISLGRLNAVAGIPGIKHRDLESKRHSGSKRWRDKKNRRRFSRENSEEKATRDLNKMADEQGGARKEKRVSGTQLDVIV
jgi:hypothetical protein